MKGRTTCPKCNHEFVMEAPVDSKTCEATCPKCDHTFAIRQSSKKSAKECGWEEHGEPRKTVLSSKKPRTEKPDVASFLLLTTCVLGIFTAVFLFSSSEDLTIPYINTNVLIDMLGIYELVTIIVIFSCFAFAGFVATLKRRYFKVAVVGAFFSIFSIGFFVGIILSIVALALIGLSKEEFENGTKGKVF